jgi:hypothetical protein
MLTFVEIEGRYYVEGLGGFGSQPFGLPTSLGEVSDLWDHLKAVYPYSPKNFAVTAGMEGPQAVLTWDPPEKSIVGIRIRRKLNSYPVSPDDGILVLEDYTTPGSRTSITDCAASNLIRMMAETLGVSESTLLFGDPLNQSFEDAAAVAEFFTAYEKRYQVQLDEEYKDGKYSLEKVVLEAQTKDLLQNASDSNWWYYRMFVQPARAEIADQFAGDGEQLLTLLAAGATWLKSEFLDVQPYKNITVIAENRSLTDAAVHLYTAPERPAPAVYTAPPESLGWSRAVASVPVDAGTSVVVSVTDASFKFMAALAVPDEPWEWNAGLYDGVNELVKVHFVVNKNIYWQSNAYLGKPCLVFKTGRHQDIVWNREHLPSAYISLDEIPGGPPKQVLNSEVITRLGLDERVNLYEERAERGPLYRFLKLMTLELDRSHNYLMALQRFNPDINTAPAEVLAHIAYELGWEVDLSRPLSDVRQELLRLAGMYKSKGTLQLCANVSEQQARVTPRIQEGSGLVMRAANPDLF